jgi:anti-sigma regulatory factor (Ser/Thr protein kinase)
MRSVITVTSPAPLQTWLSLAALPTAPSIAREYVRSVARERGLADLISTAELLASELVTNAVHASAQLPSTDLPVIRLWASSDGPDLVIHVWDAHPDLPVLKDSSADAENGRGLLLVVALGKDWGTYRTAAGKAVWCLIAAES